MNQGYSRKIRFVQSHFKDKNPFLLQEVLIPPPEAARIPSTELEILQQAAQNPDSISSSHIQHISDFQFDRVTAFPKPYETSFCYGWDWMNLNHPVTRGLVRLAAITALVKRTKKLSPNEFGSLNDAWSEFPRLESGILATNFKIETAAKTIRKIEVILSKFGEISGKNSEFQTPSIKDVVLGTTSSKLKSKKDWIFVFRNPRKKFGMPATH